MQTDRGLELQRSAGARSCPRAHQAEITGSGDNRQYSDLTSHAGTLTWDLKLCQLLQESCPKAVQKLSFSTEAENKLPED